jgi:hypothetical protein
MVTLLGEPANNSDCDSVDSPVSPPVSRYDAKTPARALAFQSPFKLSVSRLNTKEANDKKERGESMK